MIGKVFSAYDSLLAKAAMGMAMSPGKTAQAGAWLLDPRLAWAS